jgi:hypothetical protein
MLHRQSGTQLEQRLTVPLGQLIENGPSRWVGQRLEHITQTDGIIGKWLLACQGSMTHEAEVQIVVPDAGTRLLVGA